MFDNILNDLPDKYPCPTCSELKNIKLSKKNKPYYFCDYCGVQVFIRGIFGINNLIQLNKSDFLKRIVFRRGEQDYLALVKLSNKISFIQSRLNELYKKEDDYELSDKERFALNQMEKRIKSLEDQYAEKLSKL